MTRDDSNICAVIVIAVVVFALCIVRQAHNLNMKRQQQPNPYNTYRVTSNISRTNNPNLNVSPLFLQLPWPNPLKPGVKSRMKM